MKIIISLLQTENPFGRNRRVEQYAEIMVNHIKFDSAYNYQIQKLGFYDKKVMKDFKKILLSPEKNFIHVIIPCGRCAQESLEILLNDISLANIFIIFNSDWRLNIGRSELGFGEIHARQLYNIGGSHPLLPEEDYIELLDGLILLLSVGFHEKYKGYGCLTPPSIDINQTNFREKQSLKEWELWDGCKEKAKNKLLTFMILLELAPKYFLLQNFQKFNRDIHAQIGLFLLQTSSIYKKQGFFKPTFEVESMLDTDPKREALGNRTAPSS